MPLQKLIKLSMKIFPREVITFIVVHRHDLGNEERLLYVAVKPNASLSVLRQKIWHLLDLPDFCEEVLVFKNDNNVEVSITELRKGSDLQHPYILEVWLPGKRLCATPTFTNMLMRPQEPIDVADGVTTIESIEEDDVQCVADRQCRPSPYNTMKKEYEKPELISRVSSTTIFFQTQSKKSLDRFASILLKIQSDLSTLSLKLSSLEDKITR